MTKQRYVIEIDGESAGLVIAGKDGYRFHAASAAFACMERRMFRSPGHAEDECRSLTMAQKNVRQLRVGRDTRFEDGRFGRSAARVQDNDATVGATEYLPEGGLPYGFPFVVS